MIDTVKAFASASRAKRAEMRLTQEELAEKTHLSKRTIASAESGDKNPRFETVATISHELSISLDAIVLDKAECGSVPFCVVEFFSGMSPAIAEEYVALCRQSDLLNEKRAELSGK